ncbi:PaaI family thioesterase [Aeromicrobium sp.]|uniref:PaaI family thioesterase n=1 Tax=Aeromicrobium sp. TaxID=1871063 RepID=UPI002FCA1582
MTETLRASTAPEGTDAGLTQLLHDLMPFTAVLGIEALSASAELVEARATWDAERCTSGHVLHGGFLMAVADSVGAACAAYNLAPGATTTTIESKTNFMRRVGRGQVRICSTPLFVGTTTLVVQTDLIRDDGRLVSRTTQTQAIGGRNAS